MLNYTCPKCNLSIKGKQVVCPHCDSIVNYADTVYTCGSCKKPFKGKMPNCPHCNTVVKYKSDDVIKAEWKEKVKNDKKKASNKKKFTTIFWISFVVLIIVGIVIGVSSGDGGSKKKACDNNEYYDAYIYAKKFVKERLKAPSTAVFPEMREYRDHIKTIERGKKFRINSWVESQNSFGAQIRTDFSCDIIFTKDCKVQTKNLIIGN